MFHPPRPKPRKASLLCPGRSSFFLSNRKSKLHSSKSSRRRHSPLGSAWPKQAWPCAHSRGRIERFVFLPKPHTLYIIMCTARFLYYFSVYVNLFKELFSCLPTGVFPKSECKGIDFCDTLQMFWRLFFKNDG